MLSDIRLGSGQVYFDYNTDAFGVNVLENRHLEVARTGILTQKGKTKLQDIYSEPVIVDNYNGRFSIA